MNSNNNFDALVESNRKLADSLDQLMKVKGTLDFSEPSLQEYNSKFDPKVVAMATTMLTRRQLQGVLGSTHDGDRDIYKVCGYRETLDFEHYKAKWERQDIAGRIVEAPAQATWRKQPELREIRGGDTEEENPEFEETPFETAFWELEKRLGVFGSLRRADGLSGIGRYGVLFLGVRGSQYADLRQEIPEGSLKRHTDIVYLQAYSEGDAAIQSFVEDVSNPRFGEPEFYEIDMLGDLIGTGLGGTSPTRKKEISKQDRVQTVHWSRVIHIAEGKTSNNVLGIPRLQRVFNRLQDLEKIVGGDAEMWWQGGRMGLHVDVSPEFGIGDLTGAMGGSFDALEDELDKYFHGLRRFIRTRGVKINNLGIQIADPESHVKSILQLISGATGIPMRILVGSERGELASSQDEANWNSRISERQSSFAEPEVLREFVGRLQYLGALPKTPEGYEVFWPPLSEVDAKDLADIVWKKSRAIKDYADSMEARKIMDPEEFREMLGLPPMTEEQKARLAGDLGLTEEPLPEEPGAGLEDIEREGLGESLEDEDESNLVN